MSLDLSTQPVVLSDRELAFVLGRTPSEFTCRCTQEYWNVSIPYPGVVNKRSTTLFRHTRHAHTHVCDWCRLLKHLGLQPPVMVVRNERERMTTITPLQDATNHEPTRP